MFTTNDKRESSAVLMVSQLIHYHVAMQKIKKMQGPLLSVTTKCPI